MSADVVGYSALMASDEEGTLARLKAILEELVAPSVAAHGGRVVKLMGDGLLVEFPSVVEAVRSAVGIQRKLAEHNAMATGEPIAFRIGINQGDVVIDGDDIYGDGVNLATRLQERATAGGICISDRVYGDVRGRIDVGIDDLGDQELKNIPEPVRVYRVLTAPDDGTGRLRTVRLPRPWRTLIPAAAALVLLSLLGGIGWSRWSHEPVAPSLTDATKPSIAVLPFTNLSNDPSEEYFSDGITNDLITDLSRFRELMVIASNSVFAFKGQAVPVDDISRRLGVRYVLEGSVQKVGQRVRVNAQLVDGLSGRHVWAERYDEAVEDIFDLQEKITRNIVGTLAVRLSEVEQARAFEKPTDNLAAYDYVLRGRALLKRGRRSENYQARDMFRRAIELDPNYASAYAGLGWSYIYPMLYGWSQSPQKALSQAEELANRALSLSAANLDGHLLLARVYLTRRQYDLALVEAERVIAINPNAAAGYIEQGNVLLWSGHIDGAILALEAASRFDPNMQPEGYFYLGVAYFLNRRFNDAVTIMERDVTRRPNNVFPYIVLAACYAELGQRDSARRVASEVRRLDPFFKVADFGSLFSNPAHADMLKMGLRKAGL